MMHGRGKSTHYTYLIEDVETTDYYIGVRSCNCKAEADIAYWGSGWWPHKMIDEGRGLKLRKHIINTYAHRQAANDSETDLIRSRRGDLHCMNLDCPGAERTLRVHSMVERGEAASLEVAQATLDARAKKAEDIAERVYQIGAWRRNRAADECKEIIKNILEAEEATLDIVKRYGGAA